jgi:hypothetical protein
VRVWLPATPRHGLWRENLPPHIRLMTAPDTYKPNNLHFFDAATNYGMAICGWEANIHLCLIWIREKNRAKFPFTLTSFKIYSIFSMKTFVPALDMVHTDGSVRKCVSFLWARPPLARPHALPYLFGSGTIQTRG